jgi:hypothetical protein
LIKIEAAPLSGQSRRVFAKFYGRPEGRPFQD